MQLDDAVAHLDGGSDAFSELVSLAEAKDPSLKQRQSTSQAAASSSAGNLAMFIIHPENSKW